MSLSRGQSAQSFPKSARLLKSVDFRFRPYRKIATEYFHVYFTSQGQGRLGVSLSKKVIKGAVGRNRVRRLAREAFRCHRERFGEVDIHLVGIAPLTRSWQTLVRSDLEKVFFQSVGSR